MIYPSNTGGFHLFGGGGFGTYTFKPDDSTQDKIAASGGQVNAGVGYEGWVGKEWSLGGLLRLDVPFLSSTQNTTNNGRVPNGVDLKYEVTGVIPSILVNLTYNLPGDAGIACFSPSSPGPDPAW